MTAAGRLLACLAVGVLLLAGPGPAHGDEGAVRRAEQRFLTTRDTAALLDAYRASAGHVQPRRLAFATWAAGAALEPDGDGPLVSAVAALRGGELSPARRHVARAEAETPGVEATWLGALVRTRSDDDAGAKGRLMAPPLFHWDEHAFDLALLGAALPLGDRDVLMALGERALRRASERARTPALMSIALALVAFDPERGAETIAVALRALRRAGAFGEVAALHAAAVRAGVDAAHPAVVQEMFLAAWAGETDERDARRAALQAVKDPRIRALAQLGARPRRGVDLGPIHHREGDAVADVLVARMLVALGRNSDEADARAWRVQRSPELGMASYARAFLEASGVRAVTVAGDDALAMRVLETGLPFLLFRIVRTEATYAERPVLVRGYDAATRQWIVDEPHLGRVDLLPRALATKARLVIGVTAERAQLLAGAEGTPAGRAGATLEAALRATRAGKGDSAASLLGAAERPTARPVLRTYRAFLHYLHALESGAGDALLPTVPLLEASTGVAPILGFEAFTLAQARFVSGDREGALTAFGQAEDAEGGSADLSLARFAVYRVERREAASMAALDRALYHDPLDTRALFFRGALRVRRGDPEGARTDLRRALDREPTAEPFAVALADLELDNGRPDEALVVLRNLIRHEPAHATSRKVREKWQKAELGLMQRADTVDALRPFRRSPEPDTRRALAYRLAGLENTEAEGLLRLVLEDAEASVRVSVLRLYMRSWLRRRLEEDAVLLRTVCGLLRADTAEGVRAAAAHLLGRVQQRVAAQALAGALAGEARDADPVVRQAAARALAGQDVRRATDALVEALLDEAPDVRRGAIDSLFRLTGRRGGYDPEADLEARRAAQAEWRAWCEKQRGPKAPPAEDDGPDR